MNGWTFYSVVDDNKYIEDVDNFIIVNAESVRRLAPVALEIFNAPYGTDLCWVYEQGVHVGFYDLKNEKEVLINDILVGRDG